MRVLLLDRDDDGDGDGDGDEEIWYPTVSIVLMHCDGVSHVWFSAPLAAKDPP